MQQQSTQTWRAMQGKKKCRHSLDTGMREVRVQSNAMCGVASSVCVWCCVCCAVQGCQWITLCQHSPALAALVLAVGSVVYNSKENNNRENNTEDAEDQ